MFENNMKTMLEQGYKKNHQLMEAYYRLSTQPELSDQDADSLDEILQQAELDASLNFFLSEIDYMIGLTSGLRDEAHVESYRDQKAWLREHLETLDPGQIEYHRELQKLLGQRGFYKGPVDGVAGKEFHQAVVEFQHSVKLQEDGIVGLKTLTKLTTNTDMILKFTPDADRAIRLARLERCWEAVLPSTTPTESHHAPDFNQHAATD
jgi:Putative peptidoglycan binding domain